MKLLGVVYAFVFGVARHPFGRAGLVFGQAGVAAGRTDAGDQFGRPCRVSSLSQKPQPPPVRSMFLPPMRYSSRGWGSRMSNGAPTPSQPSGYKIVRFVDDVDTSLFHRKSNESRFLIVIREIIEQLNSHLSSP